MKVLCLRTVWVHADKHPVCNEQNTATGKILFIFVKYWYVS